MAFATDGKKMEVDLEFEDGDDCMFSLEPRGKTGKVSHIGIPVDPSLRLNLCPEEFWGKGDTARMETLLQMCGDSSLVTKDFISNCIKRVRVSGMTTEVEDSDLEDIKRFAEAAREFVEDGDISTLAELEAKLSEYRTDRNRELKQLKAVANDLLDDLPLVEITDEESHKVHFALQSLLAKSEAIGKKIAKEERDMEKRDSLAEKKAIADDKIIHRGKVTQLKGEMDDVLNKIASEKGRMYELLNFSAPEMKKLNDDVPHRGNIFRVEGNGVWTGESFAMINDTVSWSEDGLLDGEGNKPEEKKQNLDEIRVNISSLEKEKKELRDRIAEEHEVEGLTEKEEQWFMKNKNVDYKANIHALSSEMAEFSVKLENLREEMDKIAESRAKNQQRADLEKRMSVAERKCNVIKSVLGTVRDIQKDIINSAVNDAMGIVNAVTVGIIDEEIAWNGKNMGRTLENGTWVPIDTFSGAEKAVTQMGLGVALASRSNFRLAVLDEVSRLDKGNKNQLFVNLNTLVDQKKLDQYIAF